MNIFFYQVSRLKEPAHLISIWSRAAQLIVAGHICPRNADEQNSVLWRAFLLPSKVSLSVSSVLCNLVTAIPKWTLFARLDGVTKAHSTIGTLAIDCSSALK